jgi:predicted nuclease of predicted toxin-antitoxin system
VKLLFDQNLSYKLILALVNEFPGSVHVRDVGLAAADDGAVWDYASRFDFTIVSKDTDFSQRSFAFGAPPKVIWIRLGNCSTKQIEGILRRYFSEIQQFGLDKNSSFFVIDPLLESLKDKEFASSSYDPQSQVLQIEFKPSGEVYCYFSVPEDEYERLRSAPSKMAYVNTHIHPSYRFQKLL